MIGIVPQHEDDDFFSYGGSSLTAAQLVSALRRRYPEVTVAEVYAHPTVGDLAGHLAAHVARPRSAWTDAAGRRAARAPRGRPRAVPVTVAGRPAPRAAAAAGPGRAALAHGARGGRTGARRRCGTSPGSRPVSWWWVGAGWLLTVSPLGRLGVSALGARALLAGVRPGTYPRGGAVHLRLWAAERLVEGFGAVTPSSAPWVSLYARALGADVGRDVDLHSVPPVTGFLTLGSGCAVEPEVDLSGHWVDGRRRPHRLGHGRSRARPSAPAACCCPGARVRAGTDVAAGSAVHGSTGQG